ncbi:MAG: hypothetical protein DLM59_00830 [Pseudonocardiales bacterium]|nr:MAG: hypothetical protein DLM59_00830 [Pseudonocardiales bacterium]
MEFIKVLHIVAAVFLIGPLTFATSVSPRLIRGGAEGMPVLKLMHRVTQFYGLGTLLVAVLGLALVRKPDFTFNQFWVSASLTLFVVAMVLVFAIVERDQRAALRRMAAGDDSPVQAGRILATSAVIALIWLVTIFLMVYQPGNPKK